jgi:hypothetical protein
MIHRLGRAALWGAAGFLLGAAALAGGEGDDDLREKLLEIERLSATLRALDGERAGLPAPNERGVEFDIVSVTDLVAAVTEFCRPQRFQRNVELPLYSGPDEETWQHYGTIEEIKELIRTRVEPEAWNEGAQIGFQGPWLVLFAKPDVNRAVREFVDKELRPGARCTVNLEIEVVEAPAMAGALAAAAGGELDAALRTGLDEAIAAGKAKRLLGGRLRALSRQKVVLWHGAQEAVVADADPAATGHADPDPIVDIELLGAIVQARSTVTGDRIRVQLSLETGAADRPARTIKTEKAGTLQMAARDAARMEADLWTKRDCWAVAAGGEGRFLLVRPTVIGGGR